MAIDNFIRLLFQRLAAEQVQQTVADNLRRSTSDQSQSGDGATESSEGNEPEQAADRASKSNDRSTRELLACHVGIVVALSFESGHFEDRLAGVISIKGHGFTIRTGGLAGRGVAVAISGHGRSSAARRRRSVDRRTSAAVGDFSRICRRFTAGNQTWRYCHGRRHRGRRRPADDHRPAAVEKETVRHRVTAILAAC